MIELLAASPRGGILDPVASLPEALVHKLVAGLYSLVSTPCEGQPSLAIVILKKVRIRQISARMWRFMMGVNE